LYAAVETVETIIVPNAKTVIPATTHGIEAMAVPAAATQQIFEAINQDTS